MTNQYRFEIYVGRGFDEFECAAIAQTLKCANDVIGEKRFEWRYVSETPGMLAGANGLLVRAEPVVPDHNLSSAMIVVGGRSGKEGQWLPRMRQMRRAGREILVLSDAATTYIRRVNPASGNVTTQWHDAAALIETGDYPNLTNSLSEKAQGVTTAAGGGATSEHVITLIAPLMTTSDTAELGNRMMLQVVRTPHAEQPNDINSVPFLSDARLKLAVEMMEKSIEEPLYIYELASKVGVSTRQLERMFKDSFGLTPARVYKQLRAKRARALVEETQLPLVQIAIATGFASNSSMSNALKQKYGLSAKKMRDKRRSGS